MAARLVLLIAFLAAPAASAQPVWNIADHGAVEGRDVAPVINEGLRTQPEHGLPVYIPHGRWGVGETIQFPKRAGGALLGAGSGGISANNGLRGLGSILEWYGPPDEPMLRMTGTRWRVENLALRGAPFKSDRKRAAIGVLVTKTGKGLGTGKHEFRNLIIEACKVGFQCGLDPREHNNDLLSFERLVIEDCRIGYRVINSQSMSHLFDRLEVRKTPVMFQFFGGGMLHARNVFALQTTLLEIKRNDPPQFSPGTNNSVFRIENLKVDSLHRGKFCLVSTHEKSGAQVVLDCAMISGPAEFTLARLGRNVQLVLRDVTSPTGGAQIKKLHPAAKVVLDNVRVKGIE